MATVTPAKRERIDDALDFVRDASPEPVTAAEVGDALGVTRRAAFSYLDFLADHDDIRTKTTGSRARVWWYDDEN